MRTGIGVALAVVLLSGCGGESETQTAGDETTATQAVETVTVSGVVRLRADEADWSPKSYASNAAPCTGGPNFADISTTEVEVKDGDDVLGTTTLGDGVGYEGGKFVGVNAMCEFWFKVDVPVRNTYNVVVGDLGSETVTRLDPEMSLFFG